MKKLAFLLGSLVVVGATATAKEVVSAPVNVKEEVVAPVVVVEEVAEVSAPSKLRVTGVTTGIWSENKNGFPNGSLGENSLRLYTGFAYGDDWTGGIQLRRYFNSNANGSYGEKDLFEKTSTRAKVSVMRNNIFGNYGLGAHYEFQNSRDKYGVDFTFAPTEWLDGYLMYEYVARETQSDSHYMEFEPKLSYKGWGLSYYFEGEFDNQDQGQYMIHQMRLYTPTLKYAGFGIGAEYRGTISHEAKNYPNTITALNDNYKADGAFGVNRAYVKLSYDVNPSTTVFTNVGYEIGKWEHTETKEKGKLYQTIVEAGVSIKF